MKRFQQFFLIILALLLLNRGAFAEIGLMDGTILSEQIVHDSIRYQSTLYTVATEGGNGLHESMYAETIARDGLYSCQRLTLSQLLGLEQETEEGSSVASQLVYDLIWQIIEAEREYPETEYLEGIVKENLERILQPETDFYLDEDSNVVFFIQPGELAGEVAGPLLFPFAFGELLSAIHE